MLEWIQWEWPSHTVLRAEISTATLEISLDVSQAPRNRTTVWPNHTTHGHISRTSYLIIQMLAYPCSLPFWYIYLMEYYPAWRKLNHKICKQFDGTWKKIILSQWCHSGTKSHKLCVLCHMCVLAPNLVFVWLTWSTCERQETSNRPVGYSMHLGKWDCRLYLGCK